MPSSQSAAPNVQSSQVYWIRGAVFTALFAALFIAFSSIQFPIWYTPVPITLQTLAVMLAGGLLGATYGFWSIALVVILAGTGLPLLRGNGGLSLLLGPTAGFIWMFPFAALLIGWASDRLFSSNNRLTTKQFILLIASIIGFGIVLVYASGVPWLAYKFDLTLQKALIAGCYPFLPVDIIKSVVAAVLIRKLRPYLPRLRPAAR